MGRGAERECLDEGDPEGKARLGVIGERALRRAVDQCVEIGKAAQRFGSDGVSEAAVVRRKARSGLVERLFKRESPAQYGVEKLERGAARGDAGAIGGGAT